MSDLEVNRFPILVSPSSNTEAMSVFTDVSRKSGLNVSGLVGYIFYLGTFVQVK